MLFNPVALFIARRYLFSKKSHSVINLISIVSLVAMAIPAAAMVILLSVSNGYGEFIQSINSSFDPPIRITSTQTEYFDRNPDFLREIEKIDGVGATTQYIEGGVVLAFDEVTEVVTMRGIDSSYLEVFPIDSAIVEGRFNKYNMLIGNTVAYNLGYVMGLGGEVTVLAPSINPTHLFGIPQHFNSDEISVSGVYLLDNTTASEYVLAPEGFTNAILGIENQISAIGIEVSHIELIDQIRAILPEGFEAKDNLQQRELEYAIAQQEKIAIYIILLFIMIIASLSLISSTEMLVVEKQEQIATIKTLGANDKFIKLIFSYQSIMLALIGGVSGVVLGATITLVQYYTGIVTIGSEVALIEAYPVKLEAIDMLNTTLAIVVIGVVLSIITTKKILSTKEYEQ